MKVMHYKNLNKYGIKRDKKRSKTNNSGNYDEKYMRIKFNSDDDFPSKKTELHNMELLGLFSWRQQKLPSKFY